MVICTKSGNSICVYSFLKYFIFMVIYTYRNYMHEISFRFFERTNYMISEKKEEILEATINVFKLKGLRFTMDDIAKELSISKKTIYKVFDKKETMFLCMVDYCFDKIDNEKNKVLIDDKLSTLDKITAVLSSLPDSYRSIDFDKLYVLKKDYPLIYERVQNRLESGWENTIALLKQGINEGVVRPVNLQIFITMFEVTLEQFFKRDVLVKNNISCNEALDSVVDIMINGIANK